MQNLQIPILGFSAPSGTGKTTLLSQLIPILKGSFLRVGLIKHSHHNFEIDKPGKDSHRLRKAGASPVLLVSSHRRAIITEFETPIEPNLAEQLCFLDHSTLDLILVEGFKAEKFPKIELHRPSLKTELLFPHDPDIIAIATDNENIVKMALNKNIARASLPILDINNPTAIAKFITDKFFSGKHD